MIWTLRRLARRPGIALGASVFIAGVILVISAENFGKPLRWGLLLTLFCGGLTSGMGIAKAKREWHDAWVRQTFGDVVIGAPHEDSDTEAALVLTQSSETAEDDHLGHDRVLRNPHDGPDSDVILSLPHGGETMAHKVSE